MFEHKNSVTGEIQKKEATLKGNTVCISKDEILKRGYTAEQIFPKIAGLLAHELTHALEILGDSREDEVLADQFGRIVERHIGIMDPTEFLNEIDHDEIVMDLKEFEGTYDAFMANLDQNHYSAVCTAATLLGVAASNISSTLDRISARISGAQSLALVSPLTEDMLAEAFLRLALIPTTACGVKMIPGLNTTNFAAAFEVIGEASLLEIFRQIALAAIETHKDDPLYDEVLAIWSDPVKYEEQCEINQISCQRKKSTILRRIAYGDIETIKAEAYKAKLLINIVKGELYNLLAERARVQKEIFAIN